MYKEIGLVTVKKSADYYNKLIRSVEDAGFIRRIKMYKEISLVTVKKSADYYNKLIRAVEDAGFILILTSETSTDRYYIVAEREED